MCPKLNLINAFLDGLAFSKKQTQLNKIECKNHTLNMPKMAKTDTLFMTNSAKKPYPLEPHIPVKPI